VAAIGLSEVFRAPRTQRNYAIAAVEGEPIQSQANVIELEFQVGVTTSADGHLWCGSGCSNSVAADSCRSPESRQKGRRQDRPTVGQEPARGASDARWSAGASSGLPPSR
jgi:hypothetical protein